MAVGFVELMTRRNDMIFEGRCLNAVEVHKAT